jgi:magnesium transporter
MEREVVTVSAADDQEEVAKVVEHYNFIALPVVDDQRHLLGIITVDDILDVLREEATEDLLRMSGAGDLPQRGATVLSRLPGRLAWLMTATCVAVGIDWVVFTHLEATPQNVELFSLLPLLLILPMAAAMQSAAVSIGAVTMGTVSSEAIGPYLLRESGAGALSGILFGGLASLGVAGMTNFESFPTIGAAVACAVALATFMGSGIPLLIYRFKRDPTILGGLLVMGLVPLCSMMLGLFVVQIFH